MSQLLSSNQNLCNADSRHVISHKLVHFVDVGFRAGGRIILEHLDWSLEIGQNWAVMGRNGAGKSTFLKLVRGDLWPAPDLGRRLYNINGAAKVSPIGFREQTGLVSPELIQFYKRNEADPLVHEIVYSGFWGTTFLHRDPDEIQKNEADVVMDELEIGNLINKKFKSLSLGQSKRVLLARAVVGKPSILFLDEVGAGLDFVSRPKILAYIQKLAETGTQIICSTHVQEDLIPAITHALVMAKGRIVRQGTVNSILGAKHVNGTRMPDHSLQTDLKSPLFSIKNTNVFLKGNKVLENINWTVNSGENWAVLGANGSGKTTLLRLISGDIHPSWGGSVERRGIANPSDLWSIRRRISLVSFDMQSWHEHEQTGLEVLLSGYFGSIGLHDPVTPVQRTAAVTMLAKYEAEHLAEKNIQAMSYGMLRYLLILRAMLPSPRILLLDEPLSGLDNDSRTKILQLLDELAVQGTCLVYVTHRLDEMPGSINKVLIMSGGKISFSGDPDSAPISE